MDDLLAILSQLSTQNSGMTPNFSPQYEDLEYTDMRSLVLRLVETQLRIDREEAENKKQLELLLQSCLSSPRPRSSVLQPAEANRDIPDLAQLLCAPNNFQAAYPTSSRHPVLLETRNSGSFLETAAAVESSQLLQSSESLLRARLLASLLASSPAQPPSELKKNYRGVRCKNSKYVSEIRVQKTKKRIWLGTYPTAEAAAKAYDAATRILKGVNYPLVNFPGCHEVVAFAPNVALNLMKAAEPDAKASSLEVDYSPDCISIPPPHSGKRGRTAEQDSQVCEKRVKDMSTPSVGSTSILFSPDSSTGIVEESGKSSRMLFQDGDFQDIQIDDIHFDFLQDY